MAVLDKIANRVRHRVPDSRLRLPSSPGTMTQLANTTAGEGLETDDECASEDGTVARVYSSENAHVTVCHILLLSVDDGSVAGVAVGRRHMLFSLVRTRFKPAVMHGLDPHTHFHGYEAIQLSVLPRRNEYHPGMYPHTSRFARPKARTVLPATASSPTPSARTRC